MLYNKMNIINNNNEKSYILRSIIFLFFFLFVINQFSFIFYNYSWFSLLCSTYIIDFYNFFHFFCIYLDYISNNFSFYFSFSNEICYIILNRWNMTYINVFITYLNDVNIYNNLNNFNMSNDPIYCVYFDTKVIGNNNIFFYILQNKLFIIPGETILSFFRILNNNNYNVSAITIYNITPIEYQSFINKIQCFCFEEIIIYNFEIVELPVLFYLDSNIIYLDLLINKELCIEYILLCNKVA